jgi:MtN3 and saliva related transmembrane protein
MSPVIVGYVASVATVLSFLPQVVRAWKTKSVKDLSYMMLGLLITSALLWITYGVLKSDMPIILTNVGTLLLEIAILVAKIRFR